jgi:hypothetical protein
MTMGIWYRPTFASLETLIKSYSGQSDNLSKAGVMDCDEEQVGTGTRFGG